MKWLTLLWNKGSTKKLVNIYGQTPSQEQQAEYLWQI